jgi:hypothetical protein
VEIAFAFEPDATEDGSFRGGFYRAWISTIAVNTVRDPVRGSWNAP